METEKLQDKGFVKFCDVVKFNLGEASTEVLYAWYFNTFDLKTLTPKQTTKTENKK